jgi:hypothetical protein
MATRRNVVGDPVIVEEHEPEVVHTPEDDADFESSEDDAGPYPDEGDAGEDVDLGEDDAGEDDVGEDDVGEDAENDRKEELARNALVEMAEEAENAAERADLALQRARKGAESGYKWETRAGSKPEEASRLLKVIDAGIRRVERLGQIAKLNAEDAADSAQVGATRQVATAEKSANTAWRRAESEAGAIGRAADGLRRIALGQGSPGRRRGS